MRKKPCSPHGWPHELRTIQKGTVWMEGWGGRGKRQALGEPSGVAVNSLHKCHAHAPQQQWCKEVLTAVLLAPAHHRHNVVGLGLGVVLAVDAACREGMKR